STRGPPARTPAPSVERRAASPAPLVGLTPPARAPCPARLSARVRICPPPPRRHNRTALESRLSPWQHGFYRLGASPLFAAPDNSLALPRYPKVRRRGIRKS